MSYTVDLGIILLLKYLTQLICWKFRISPENKFLKLLKSYIHDNY